MLNILIDNLSRLEDFAFLIPSLVQLSAVTLWIIIIKTLHFRYHSSIILSLILLSAAAVLSMLSLFQLAGGVGEYAFIFLIVGTVQMIFSNGMES